MTARHQCKNAECTGCSDGFTYAMDGDTFVSFSSTRLSVGLAGESGGRQPSGLTGLTKEQGRRVVALLQLALARMEERS